MKFPTLRFFAAVAIAFTVVNHFGIDLNAIDSNQSWIQSDRAEARRSGGRARGGSFSNSRPRSTTRSSSWSNGTSSGGTRHTTSAWSDDHGVGQSSTTSTHSTSSWSTELSSGRSSQSSVIHRSTYSGTHYPTTAPVIAVDAEESNDSFMQLMMLFLLLGGGIAAGLLVYLIYKQMAEQRSPVK